MRNVWIVMTLSLGLGAAGSVHADLVGELARCRAIEDIAARLGCYDALTPPGAAAAVSAPASAFGFENRRPADLPDTIETRFPGPMEGWGPHTRFKLENGQVWQVIDGSRGVARLVDPKVRISRASFGTFFLQFDGLNQAPRVRRVE